MQPFKNKKQFNFHYSPPKQNYDLPIISDFFNQFSENQQNKLANYLSVIGLGYVNQAASELTNANQLFDFIKQTANHIIEQFNQSRQAEQQNNIQKLKEKHLQQERLKHSQESKEKENVHQEINALYQEIEKINNKMQGYKQQTDERPQPQSFNLNYQNSMKNKNYLYQSEVFPNSDRNYYNYDNQSNNNPSYQYNNTYGNDAENYNQYYHSPQQQHQYLQKQQYHQLSQSLESPQYYNQKPEQMNNNYVSRRLSNEYQQNQIKLQRASSVSRERQKKNILNGITPKITESPPPPALMRSRSPIPRNYHLNDDQAKAALKDPDNFQKQLRNSKSPKNNINKNKNVVYWQPFHHHTSQSIEAKNKRRAQQQYNPKQSIIKQQKQIKSNRMPDQQQQQQLQIQYNDARKVRGSHQFLKKEQKQLPSYLKNIESKIKGDVLYHKQLYENYKATHISEQIEQEQIESLQQKQQDNKNNYKINFQKKSRVYDQEKNEDQLSSQRIYSQDDVSEQDQYDIGQQYYEKPQKYQNNQISQQQGKQLFLSQHSKKGANDEQNILEIANSFLSSPLMRHFNQNEHEKVGSDQQWEKENKAVTVSDFEPKHSTVISQYDRYGNSAQKSLSFNWAGTYNTSSVEKEQYLSLMHQEYKDNQGNLKDSDQENYEQSNQKRDNANIEELDSRKSSNFSNYTPPKEEVQQFFQQKYYAGKKKY